MGDGGTWKIAFRFNGRKGGRMTIDREIGVGEDPLAIAAELQREAVRDQGAIFVRGWSIDYVAAPIVDNRTDEERAEDAELDEAEMDRLFDKYANRARDEFCEAVEGIQTRIEAEDPRVRGGPAAVMVLSGVADACGAYVAAANLPESTVQGIQDGVRNGFEAKRKETVQ